MMKKQQGMMLMMAMFLVVVLSLISAYVVNISATARDTNNLSIESTRAYFAAKSGVEWGIFQVIDDPTTCPPTTTLNINQAGIGNFSVQVTCSSSSHGVGNSVYNYFTITGKAEKGNFGDVGYVSRTVRLSTLLQES